MSETELIWDPLRKKNVALTPEERVRQWFIGFMMERMKIPAHMMRSEVGFKLGSKQYRADIVVFDRKASPLAVVECKRPEVELDAEVLNQAIRYNMVLDVKYIVITNGAKTYMCRKKGTHASDGYEQVRSVPVYDEMIGQSGIL